MLRSIYIDNYALIEKLEIDFRNGLTIITGETGAGKSILLGALGLLQGKRADTSVLKDTDRKCVVEGVFAIDGYGLENFFSENELDYHPETIIRREILNSGKSRAFINDTPVNLSIVQNLSLSLIDIHSQHQNLSLNDESYLRWIVDTYAGITEDVAAYSLFFEEYKKLKKVYQTAREEFQSDQQELEYITHQFNELQEAKLNTEEMASLEEEQDQMNHAEEIKTAFQTIIELLQNADSGIIPGMKQAEDTLNRIKEHLSAAQQLHERLESCYIEMKDIAQESEMLFDRLDFDPERYTYVNSRIDLLYTLLRKYKKNTVEELIQLRENLDERLNKHASGDYELEKLAKELAGKENSVKTKAKELSQARTSAFSKFEQKVIYLITGLGIDNGSFKIDNEIVEPTSNGIDRIQFLFSANRNIPTQSIAKVASGGELSRLMLAVKYLISNSAGLPTILFDEIDTGVSGEIADKMGKLIKDMSGSMQVINITHLPQVASKGDQHFLVYKDLNGDITNTLIKELNDDERLTEIAKMLSGDRLTDAALANAKVLLNG